MNIIRDEGQAGQKTACISMIPLFVQWGINRCNIAGCCNPQTTIVAGLKDAPVFGICEDHYLDFTNEDRVVNITLEFQ